MSENLLNTKVDSPTMASLLEQKCEITFVGKPGGYSRSRTVNGDKWLGLEYTYQLSVPQKDKENWITELRVWTPTSIVRKFYRSLPETQVYIQTGTGEMLLTDNPEKKQLVMQEIHRQLELAAQKN